ncbi:MAG: radical SAM protein [candidate division Zixibacteria bacterium]|nr:radical SAM protein [candidate division Zixibacteria bacterium]
MGRTTQLRAGRKSFFPKEDILAEIIESAPKDGTDYVTFVGDGEPTLNKDLGWLIQRTKEKLHLPVAVITNGSLLFKEDVREDLGKADVVVPTLDAGNERMFRIINQSSRRIRFKKMLQGLIDFRPEYSGQIWMEVMLIKDLNDTTMELQAVKHAIDMINPDRVYVLTPVRPPAEPWVRPSDPETILKAQEIIGSAIPVTGLETGQFGLGEFSDARQAILEIGSRHPLRREQVAEIEKEFSISGVVRQMVENKELVNVKYNGEEYLLPGHFARGR